ncbi:hypothetical protein UPYG_G00239700 [Umbra pygmaea]|uniref:ZP domain-containing protein n=1 Tax=Umbra pygmaea TaxID=75934 RepID=A0ABD0WF19_UMBPY
MSLYCKIEVIWLRAMLGMLFLFSTFHCTVTLAPVGTFQTLCHERHFWLVVKSGFLGPVVKFKFEDHRGGHFLSGQQSSECGYTMLYNHRGDLVFRASFLACHVDHQGDSELRLRGWLLTRQVDGTEVAYPFHLQCSLLWPWASREIVCEENYMEVSIKRPVLTSVLLDEVKGGVTFHRPGGLQDVSGAVQVTEARALGYHISETASRVILRCPYSSPFSYTLEDKGVDLEVVNTTILYRREEKLLAVSVTLACPVNEATMDGARVLWSFPQGPSPLVQGPFRTWGVRMGVESLVLGQCAIQERGYSLRLREGLIEISIPFGAEGTYIKSSVLEGRFSQLVSVDLFFLFQWEEQRWPLTQHRSFRLLNTPQLPWKPTLTDNTSLSLEEFSITLGAFPPDVSLHNVTVGGQGGTLSWELVAYPNRTHSYQLQVPFSHPRVLQQFGRGGYRTYTLPLSFALTISPHGEVFYHNATVVSYVQEPTGPPRTPLPAPDLPQLEGRCMEKDFLVLMHYGTQGRRWELFIGAHRLDWELVKTGGFKVETKENQFSVWIPLFSPGVTFQEMSLRGLVAQVTVSAVDIDTKRVDDRIIQSCSFHVKELQVCLPEWRVLIVTDISHKVPPIHPNLTTLLDPSCVPQETDGTRALFNFSLDSCGTLLTVQGDLLVYENRVLYPQETYSSDPRIYREGLTFQCRYRTRDTGTVSSEPRVPSAFPRSHLPHKRTRREASSRAVGSGQYMLVVGVHAVLVEALLLLYICYI